MSESRENRPVSGNPEAQTGQENIPREVEQSHELSRENEGAKAVEQAPPSAPPPAPPPQDSAQASTQAVPPQPVADNQSGATTAAPQARDWMPQIADDTDLIEKEWVDKAKEIVARTAHDPYLQNKEINKVKAEYLKKRYNKVLKRSD